MKCWHFFLVYGYKGEFKKVTNEITTAIKQKKTDHPKYVNIQGYIFKFNKLREGFIYFYM